MNKMKIAGLLGGVLLLCGAQAQADITWSFGGATSESGTVGNTISKTSGTVMVTAQAWANTNDGTVGSLGSNSSDAAKITAENAYKLETAYLNVYSGGLGVKNQDASGSSSVGDQNDGTSPEHATDNNQRYDSVLFKFDSAIDLNSVTIGWWTVDSDISVLRYNGVGDASNQAGKTYAQLLTSGWSLVSQNASSTATTKNLDGSATSSYWLIGAANSLLGTTMDGTGDYVKISTIAGTKANGAPEPGTMLLMGAGLLGLARMSRRNPARSLAA